MKITATLIGLVISITLMAGPAQAEEVPWPVMRQASTEVCIQPDFPVVGSGWRIHAAIREWNSAQSSVHLSATTTPGCSPVIVHRYMEGESASTYCGYTSLTGEVGLDGITILSKTEVWLNDRCRMDPPLTKRWSKYLVGHELGHALGLGHTFDDRTSIMCYCNNWPVLGGKPGANDAATLAVLYAQPVTGKSSRVAIHRTAAYEARQQTRAQTLVLPRDHVFRNSDPIKVCYGAYVKRDTDTPVKIAVEWKVVGRKGWSLYGETMQHVNKVRCSTADLRTQNGRDMIIRTRVIQTPAFARSEHRVYVEVQG